MIYCENCGENSSVQIQETSASYVLRREIFEIKENHLFCTKCGREVQDKDDEKKRQQRLTELYQRRYNMFPEDIKRIRKSMRLTQSEFADVLNMGKATIKRYETGGSLPDGVLLGVLRVLRKNPELILMFFEETKAGLPEKERQRIEEKLQPLMQKRLK
ncbi:hypothetical protein AWH49_18125 [Domibacillus aminovorans]|uniref:HTH cro/C1-type domain-containing protein n=2 Tax=Domibacillus aminovorans TaxID=29332 RepID=A0A177L381_9BACI|nr:hypothetical protein AWH49_18125 [Domibacillus aminovorans]